MHIDNETFMKQLKGDMKLVAKTCGIEVARTLMQRCGGRRFYIPKEEHFTRKIISNAVISRRKAGQTIGTIALELGISERMVYRVLELHKATT